MENFLQVLAAADHRVLVEAGPVAVAAVAFVVVLVVAVAAAVVVVDLQEGLFRSCMDLLTPASRPIGAAEIVPEIQPPFLAPTDCRSTGADCRSTSPATASACRNCSCWASVPASCPSLRTARHRGSSPSWTWVRPGKTDPFPA